jgi:hypothetical protein
MYPCLLHRMLAFVRRHERGRGGRSRHCNILPWSYPVSDSASHATLRVRAKIAFESFSSYMLYACCPQLRSSPNPNPPPPVKYELRNEVARFGSCLSIVIVHRSRARVLDLYQPQFRQLLCRPANGAEANSKRALFLVLPQMRSMPPRNPHFWPCGRQMRSLPARDPPSSC